MGTEIAFFDNPNNSQLPAHLQGVNFGVTGALMQGIFSGGNRIGVKGSRFRIVINGNEEQVIEENYLDVIIVAAAPAVSRRYYKGVFVNNGENAPPVCYSADGIAPPDDVKQKQSDKCATCPHNIKGSKVVDGVSMKACAYFRRLVLTIPNDDRETVFQFDANAQTLFSEGNATAKSLNDYIKMLATRGVDAGQIITRMSFDTDASVPKVLFKPVGFVSAEQVAMVSRLVNSDEVKLAATVNMTTIDLGSETSSVNAGADETTAAPAQTQAPAQTAQKPAAAQTQRPAATTQAARPAARPATVQAAPVVETIPVEIKQAEIPAAVEVSSNSDLEAMLADLDI